MTAVPSIIPAFRTVIIAPSITTLLTTFLSTFFPPVLAAIFTALHAPLLGAGAPHNRRSSVVRVPAMPVPVAPFGTPDQGPRNPTPLNGLETVPGVMGTVPAVGPAAPVPAKMEEDFILETLHHLNARLHHHERRSDRKAQIDVHIHLRLGWSSCQQDQTS